jgi:NADPH2:quinone reductase
VGVVLHAVGKDTFDISLKCLDYLGWMVSFGNASGKPEPLDVLRSAGQAGLSVSECSKPVRQ